MKGIDTIKEWVGALTELALMLLALAIVLSLLVGSNLPFFGAVTANIMSWVKDMGGNGLVGLITLGIVLWLFSNRKMACRELRARLKQYCYTNQGGEPGSPPSDAVCATKRFCHAEIHGQREKYSLGIRRTRFRHHSCDHVDLPDPRTRFRDLRAIGGGQC